MSRFETEDRSTKEMNLKTKNIKERNTKDSIQVENRKAKKIFILMVLTGGIAGGFIGFFSMMGREGVLNFFEDLKLYLAGSTDILMIITIAVMLLLLLSAVGLQRSMLKKNGLLNLENGMEIEEDKIDEVENKLNLCLSIANVNTFLVFGLFSLSVYLFFGAGTRNFSLIGRERFFVVAFGMLISAVLLIANAFVMIKMQQKIIDIIRMINPDKKGSVYEFNFNRKWEKSSDERERLQIYYCGYKAFNAAKMTCLIIWAIGMITGIAFEMGYSVSAAMAILMIMMQIVYGYYSYHFRLTANGVGDIVKK